MITMCVTPLLLYDYHDYTYRIKFYNLIMVDKKMKKVKQCLYYRL